MIPASPESYDFQPRHYFPKKKREFPIDYYIILFLLFFVQDDHRLGFKARGGSDARVGELMIIAKQVETSNPFFFSSTFRFFLQKKGFFRFCGRDPSKMTILAPSRKPVRIGLYREGRKGPKSTFFGWSVFGVLGFIEVDEFSSLFSIHYRL